jgi:acetolactate synthase-1/2/3 large subunit
MPGVPLIHFDTRKTDLPAGENVNRFTGTPEEWFRVLEHLNPENLIREDSIIRGIRDEMISVFNGFSASFGPVAALRVLKEKLPAGVSVTADVGSHLHLLGQIWESGTDGDFIISNGWSGMGFGIPAANAVSLCRPGKHVVCITGDGGFVMTSGEILTARRYNLPVIVVVLSDGELNLIRLKQSWKGSPPLGTMLCTGDLFGSDTFLGVKVLKADSEVTMAQAVSFALSLNEPVIINTIIDPDDYKYLIVKQ